MYVNVEIQSIIFSHEPQKRFEMKTGVFTDRQQ
jgi:hypothetical protein